MRSTNLDRQCVNRLRGSVVRWRSLFHRAQRGSVVWLKSGRQYRMALADLRDAEQRVSRG